MPWPWPWWGYSTTRAHSTYLRVVRNRTQRPARSSQHQLSDTSTPARTKGPLSDCLARVAQRPSHRRASQRSPTIDSPDIGECVRHGHAVPRDADAMLAESHPSRPYALDPMTCLYSKPGVASTRLVVGVTGALAYFFISSHRRLSLTVSQAPVAVTQTCGYAYCVTTSQSLRESLRALRKTVGQQLPTSQFRSERDSPGDLSMVAVVTPPWTQHDTYPHMPSPV
jgi:hypothetical protein